MVHVALVSIGEAARMLGLNASALRYYEERGLIEPVTRHAGKRMYDTDQLRRLVLVQIMQRLRIPLDAAAAVLDENSAAWRDHLARQVEELDDLIHQATLARDFLVHARNCPNDHPVTECPKLIEVLDRRLAGVSFEQLIREYADPAGPDRHRAGNRHPPRRKAGAAGEHPVALP